MKSLKISGVLLYLFGLVLVLLLYFYYIFSPISEQVALLDQQHMVDQAQLQIYENALAGIEDLRAGNLELQDKIDLAKANQGTKGLDVADDVRIAMSRSGASLQGLSVSDAAPDASGAISSSGAPLYSVSVSLNCQSARAQYLDLLDYFEQDSPGAYAVSSVTVDSSEEVYNVSLTLVLYYFQEAGKKS